MSDEQDDLISQASEPRRGAVTQQDVSGVPQGRVSGWERMRADRSYYSPALDAYDAWQPAATEYLDGDPERAQAVATAEQLGGGIVRRIIENMAKVARGERVPTPKPSGYCSTGDHAVDIAAEGHVDRLRYYQDGQCGACRRGERKGGLLFRLRWPFRRRR